VLVRAKAPLRVSFAGGGTDVSPFPETEGGVVLSATIDRYAYGSLRTRADGTISIESVDFGLSLDFPAEGMVDGTVFDGRLDLVKAAIRRLSMDDTGGYDLLLRSTAPPGSGLGSSSTIMVALVGLLREYYSLPLSEYEIAHLAWEIERRDLGISGGLQDNYAATFGGFNFMEFGDRVIVNPLRVRDSIVNELELNLLLCYTGITRESAHIIGDQTDRVHARDPRTLSGLRAQKELAVAMKAALLRGELDAFGELLGQAWLEKKKLSPLITNDLIDEAYDLAMRCGAVGGKVTGAGGGGYILFYCDFTRKHRVAEALEKLGASVTEFSFERRGLTTWRVP
jgi:D-glycero-alpha-D-manno-heptose-7-phosphate kinase